MIVTLNPPVEPDPRLVLRELEYAHPLLDGRAVAAQQGFAALQGARNTYYAGAWLGYGFHEDGLASAHAVAGRHGRRSLPFAARRRLTPWERLPACPPRAE